MLAEKTAAYVLVAGPKDLNFVTNKLDGKAPGIELTKLPIPAFTPLP